MEEKQVTLNTQVGVRSLNDQRKALLKGISILESIGAREGRTTLKQSDICKLDALLHWMDGLSDEVNKQGLI